MADLSEQLGALLFQEIKYATRDYLLDITPSQHGHCDSGGSAACQVTPSREESPFTATTATATATATTRDDYHKEQKSNDASPLSRSTSTLTNNNALITEQHAVDWREKICEWSYQGTSKICSVSMQKYLYLFPENRHFVYFSHQ